MTIENLRTSISEVIAAENCSAEFFFLLESNDTLLIKKADIDEDTQTELTQNFIDSINNKILLNDDLSLVNISSADDRTQAIYKYDLEEIPTELENLSSVLENENFDLFDFNQDSLRSLKGIIILIGNEDRQLALYKHQYPVALLKRSSFNLIKIRNQNRLEKLNEDILRINSTFEFLRINQQYYIVDLRTLERFFGFHKAIRNMASQGIANIIASNLIENPQVLTDRLNDISFSRKLVRSARNSPVLGVIPNMDIISFVNTHPSLRGKFTLSNDRNKLELKTKTSQNLFLKLLNDDFLQSELTKRYYASLAKDSIESTPTNT